MTKTAETIPLPIRAAKVLARLEAATDLCVEEKSVHALGLAATPEERWELMEKNVRSLGLWKPSTPTESTTF
jgi:hypothetical protein